MFDRRNLTRGTLNVNVPKNKYENLKRSVKNHSCKRNLTRNMFKLGQDSQGVLRMPDGTTVQMTSLPTNYNCWWN